MYIYKVQLGEPVSFIGVIYRSIHARLLSFPVGWNVLILRTPLHNNCLVFVPFSSLSNQTFCGQDCVTVMFLSKLMQCLVNSKQSIKIA